MLGGFRDPGPRCPGDGFDESPGIGMRWTIENVVDWAALDDLAAVQDVDAVGDLADDREVVRDEQVAEAELARAASLSRLRICACTETSSAETGSSQTISLRLHGERAGDRDPLALAARERGRLAPA